MGEILFALGLVVIGSTLYYGGLATITVIYRDTHAYLASFEQKMEVLLTEVERALRPDRDLYVVLKKYLEKGGGI